MLLRLRADASFFLKDAAWLTVVLAPAAARCNPMMTVGEITTTFLVARTHEDAEV